MHESSEIGLAAKQVCEKLEGGFPTSPTELFAVGGQLLLEAHKNDASFARQENGTGQYLLLPRQGSSYMVMRGSPHFRTGSDGDENQRRAVRRCHRGLGDAV